MFTENIISQFKMLLYVCFCLLALGHATAGKTLPQGVSPPCHRSDPGLDACLLQNAGFAVKYLKDGIPELGLKPIDPLKIDFMSAEGDLEFIKIKMVMKNVTLTSLTDAVFKKVKFDPNSLSGEVSISIPNMQMICDYFATGRLFVIPLESSAHFDGNFTDTDFSVSFRLKTTEKKGREYFTVDKLNLKMRVNKAHIKLVSIDPANQQQVNVIQDFFNENDRLVLDTVNPIANDYGGEFFKHVVESYIRRLPTNEILPN